MRILFAYTGASINARKRGGKNLLDDLHGLSTTHMSEVNYLLLCYWLQKLGHEVSILSSSSPKTGEYHLPIVALSTVNPEMFDALLLFKVQGLKFSVDSRFLSFPWKRIFAWLDGPAPENILGDQAQRITAFAWGTPGILALGKNGYPKARHVLCEHATVFSEPPVLGDTEPRGLYAGRLPQVYLDQVLLAAKVCPMLVYALWVSTGGDRRILLRPGQFDLTQLQQAQTLMPASVDLRSGINVIAQATEVSKAAFGLCPATGDSNRKQILSASKFYDYLALGLPVVLGDSTPEAQVVRDNPLLGELYAQGTPGSLEAALNRVLVRNARTMHDRLKIQSWVFSHATYKHRAGVLHDLVG